MCDSIRNCQEQQIQKHRMSGHFTVKSSFSEKAFKYRVHPQEMRLHWKWHHILTTKFT